MNSYVKNPARACLSSNAQAIVYFVKKTTACLLQLSGHFQKKNRSKASDIFMMSYLKWMRLKHKNNLNNSEYESERVDLPTHLMENFRIQTHTMCTFV